QSLQRVVAGAIVVEPIRNAFDALHDQVGLGRVQRAARWAGFLHHIEIVRRVRFAARAEYALHEPRDLLLRQGLASVEVAATVAAVEQGVEAGARLTHQRKHCAAIGTLMQRRRRRTVALAQADGRVQAFVLGLLYRIESLPAPGHVLDCRQAVPMLGAEALVGLLLVAPRLAIADQLTRLELARYPALAVARHPRLLVRPMTLVQP